MAKLVLTDRGKNITSKAFYSGGDIVLSKLNTDALQNYTKSEMETQVYLGNGQSKSLELVIPSGELNVFKTNYNEIAEGNQLTWGVLSGETPDSIWIGFLDRTTASGKGDFSVHVIVELPNKVRATRDYIYFLENLQIAVEGV